MLGIPGQVPIPYQLECTVVLLQSLHALFQLLTSGNTMQYCPQAAALRGETGFASVFGPQNEGHKFTRKCNLTLDTSMAKPTRKPLLRMVEREEYLECLGTSVERPV